MTAQQIADLWDIWQAARIAFAPALPSWYERARWTVRQLRKLHPAVNATHAYLTLESAR